MRLEVFYDHFFSITGTTLQIETEKTELFNQTEVLEFLGIVKNVDNNKIIFNLTLKENYFQGRALEITAFIDGSKRNGLFSISKGDLLKVKCLLKDVIGNSHLTCDLSEFSILEYGKVFINITSTADYVCIQNGKAAEILDWHSERDYYTLYLISKGENELVLKQTSGYVFFPSTFRKSFNFKFDRQEFYWKFPK